MTRGSLDRRIAAGCPCGSSAALALRADQLVDRRTRQRLARSLREVVTFVPYADRVGLRARRFSLIVIERPPVRANRAALLGLAERLDGPDPIDPRGIILTRMLLTDGANSPLFNRNCERTVTEAVWEIADALGVDEPPAAGF